MCLIILGWQAHPDYPLVVAANRDEFLARPAVPAHWWTDAPGLLAGRDLEGGGTWLGLSRGGRFAALTNYRDPTLHRPGAPSRGALVRGCLTGNEPAVTALSSVAAVSADYAAFNLLACDGRNLGIHESTAGTVRLLGPGIYALSNHLLDTPWPKVRRARERFAAAMTGDLHPDAVLTLLRDDTPAPEAELPSTGVARDWERWLSPAFIRAPGYGTRCSTFLTMRRDGEVKLREWTWDERGELSGEVLHRFGIRAEQSSAQVERGGA